MSRQKKNPSRERNDFLSLRNHPRKIAQETGQKAVQYHIEIPVAVGIISYKDHFNITKGPVHRTETHRLSYRKAESKEVLLPEEGEEIKVIHV